MSLMAINRTQDKESDAAPLSNPANTPKLTGIFISVVAVIFARGTEHGVPEVSYVRKRKALRKWGVA